MSAREEFGPSLSPSATTVGAMWDEIDQLRTLLGEVADWVCQMGYPIDFTTENLPPPGFRSLIEDAWVRSDRDDDPFPDVRAAEIRALIAEEWDRDGEFRSAATDGGDFGVSPDAGEVLSSSEVEP